MFHKIDIIKIISISMLLFFNYLLSQTQFWDKTNGPYGCKVNAIAFTNSEVIYIGTEGQGIYISIDNGLSWSKVEDNINIENVNSIAINDSGYIFVSCDKEDLSSGIYRSEDQGKTWIEIASIQGEIIIYKIDTLFISTKYNSILRSDNNGDDWIYLGEQPSTPWAIWDIAIDTSGNLWVASPGYVSQNITNPENYNIMKESDKWLQGVYFSIDKGLSWVNLTEDNLDFTITSIITNSLGTIITSTYPEYANMYFWSNNYGQTWQEVINGNRPPGANSLCFFNDSVAFSGTRNGIYKTSNSGANWTKQPTDFNDKVNIINNSPNDLIFAGTDYAILYSDDAGTTWQESFDGLPEVPTYALLTINNNIHAGGASGGIFKSVDKGGSWTSHRKVNDPYRTNLGSQNIYALESDFNDRIFAGSSDWGTLYYSDDGGISWDISEFSTSQDQGAVWSLLVDDSNYVYLGTNGAGLWISKDNGLTIEFSGISFGWIRALAKGRDGSIYVGTHNQGVSRSQNHGASWTQINNGLPSSPVYTITVSEENIVYAGTNYGLYRLNGNDLLWEEVNSDLGEKDVSSILTQPDGKLFIGTFFNGVYYSSNYGDSLVKLNAGLEDNRVWTFGVDNANYLFVGTNKGVYKSTSPISSIKTQNKNNVSVINLNQNYPNPFNPSTTIEFSLPKSEFTTLKVYNILGKEVMTIVSQKLNPGKHTYLFDGNNLACGVYYYFLVAGGYSEMKKMILLR